MNKILVVAVVILSLVACSSAQSESQPSAQCIAAYNATFDTPTNCSTAFTLLVAGAATTQQKMMVCDANQQCNDILENIIDLCGNTVSQLQVEILCIAVIKFSIIDRSFLLDS